MLLTHVSNFVHKSPKMTKFFRRFREEIAPVWVKTVVVFGLSIFIKSLIYQLSSLVLEIFFQWVVILKFLILFCVWSIYVFSAPFLKKVCLKGVEISIFNRHFFQRLLREKLLKMTFYTTFWWRLFFQIWHLRVLKCKNLVAFFFKFDT